MKMDYNLKKINHSFEVLPVHVKEIVKNGFIVCTLGARGLFFPLTGIIAAKAAKKITSGTQGIWFVLHWRNQSIVSPGSLRTISCWSRKQQNRRDNIIPLQNYDHM